MNRWAYQQRALVGGCAADGVVCPKPRRIGGAPHQFYEPARQQSRFINFSNQQTETCDAAAGRELLDIIRMKADYDSGFQVASSPPFFGGSPPSRASNPIIRNENFGNPSSPPKLDALASGRRSGGCTRVKAAPVRIEGFDCRGNCSISAVA